MSDDGAVPPASLAPPPGRAVTLPGGIAARQRAEFDLLLEDRFIGWSGLDEYVSDLIEPELLAPLTQAIEEEVGHALRGAQVQGSGAVVASNVLLGLAAVRLFGASIAVPLVKGEPVLTRSNADWQLRSGRRPVQWLDALGDLGAVAAPQAETVLIRAWDLTPAALAQEGAKPVPEVLGRCRLVWLVRRAPGDASPDGAVLLDIADRTPAILARVIRRLGLPADQPATTEAEADAHLARILGDLGATPDDVLAALNTRAQVAYDDLASRLDERDDPTLSDYVERYITTPKQNAPCHAAALFVAAHFPGLPPGQFLEIADLLAAQTSADFATETDTHHPSQVTDKILGECGIIFAKAGGDKIGAERAVSGRVAILAPGKPDALSRKDRMDGRRQAGSLARQFDRRASLLKERYLAALAGHLMLGHMSRIVADQYASLERAALVAIAAVDPGAALDRLTRVVFGYAAFIQAREGFVDANMPRLRASLRRSLVAARPLVQSLAQGTPGLRLQTLTAALCQADPIDPDVRWVEAFRNGAAHLFWSVYADDPAAVTLDGFPALFDRDPEAVHRREDLLRVLGAILQRQDVDPLLNYSAEKFREPQLLATLVAAIGEAFSRLTGVPEHAPGRLLTDVASQFLLLQSRAGPQRPEGAEPAQVADQTLAEALLSDQVSDVLYHHDRVGLPDGDGRDAALDIAGRRVWLAARAVMAWVLGSASLGAAEGDVLNLWLLERLGLDDAELPEVRFDDRWLWHRFCDPVNQEAFDRLLRSALRPVLDLFPLAVLMAMGVDRDGPPRMAVDLRQWLTERDTGLGSAALARLGRCTDTALVLADQWSGIFQRRSIKIAPQSMAPEVFKTRRKALRSYRQQLAALADTRRAGRRAARHQANS